MTQTVPKPERNAKDTVELFFVIKRLFCPLYAIISNFFAIMLCQKTDGIQEISGSIPLISTTKTSKFSDFGVFSFVLRIKKFCFRPSFSRGETF